MARALVLGALLVAYNTVLPLLPGRAQDRVYVPLNLALTGLLLAWALTRGGLSPAEVGLGGRGWLRAALVGAGVGFLLTLPLWAFVLLRPSLPGPLASLRPPHPEMTLGDLLYRVSLRIPLGTAVWEEVAFRGVLYGLLLAPFPSRWPAALLSSLFFALWHIGPSIRTFQMTGVPLGGPLGVLAWGGMGVGTFLGGLLFVGLREAGGHLLAPIVAHALINASAQAAFFLLKEMGPAPPP